MNVELLNRAEAHARFPGILPALQPRQKVLVVDGEVWGFSVVSRVRGVQKHRILPVGAMLPFKPHVYTASELPFLVRDLINAGDLPEAVERHKANKHAEAVRLRAAEKRKAADEADLWYLMAHECVKPIAGAITFEAREDVVRRILQAMKWSQSQ